MPKLVPAARRLTRAVALLMLFAVPAFAQAAFPFDQQMILDVQPIGPNKRVPMLTVEPNGNATLQLWCRDVRAHVALDGNAIRVEAAPLPEALPPYMGEGQCSPERMQADADLLAVFAQMTGWRRQGGHLELSGPATLRFSASSH